MTDATNERIDVTRDDAGGRYEATIGGRPAGYADFRRVGGVVVFPHTVTLPEFEGRGVASAIARFSLDEARGQGLRVRPDCSFYAGWIGRHPQYADLLH